MVLHIVMICNRTPVWRPDSQGRLGCPKSGHGCPKGHHRYPGSGHGCPDGVELMLRLHQKCLRMVKLVMGLHHVSQEGYQREFRDGRVSMWASPCEFWW